MKLLFHFVLVLLATRSESASEEPCVDVASLEYEGKQTNCDVVYSSRSKCYKLEEKCCYTCTYISSVDDHQIPNCPYSDRNESLIIDNKQYICRRAVDNPERCSDSRIARICCASCFYGKLYADDTDEK